MIRKNKIKYKIKYKENINKILYIAYLYMNAEFFLILAAVIAFGAHMSAQSKQHGGKTMRHRNRHSKSVKHRKH